MKRLATFWRRGTVEEEIVLSREPDYTGLSLEERRIVSRAWQRLWRTIHGALVNSIHCHGPIGTGHLPSAMKRLRGQGKDPVDEFLRAVVERKEVDEIPKDRNTVQ